MITKLQALLESMVLWEDMAETGKANKKDSKVWDINGGTIPSRSNDCPCCEYVIQQEGDVEDEMCKKSCPAYAIWGNQRCDARSSIYRKWREANTSEERKLYASEIAQGFRRLYEEELSYIKQKEKKDMNRPFEVGEPVYDDVFMEWGEVDTITPGLSFPVRMKALSNEVRRTYTEDGRYLLSDNRPQLHHADEIVNNRLVIEVLPPPKKKVKKLVWLNFYKFRLHKSVDGPFDTEGEAGENISSAKNYTGTFPAEIEETEE